MIDKQRYWAHYGYHIKYIQQLRKKNNAWYCFIRRIKNYSWLNTHSLMVLLPNKELFYYGPPLLENSLIHSFIHLDIWRLCNRQMFLNKKLLRELKISEEEDRKISTIYQATQARNLASSLSFLLLPCILYHSPGSTDFPV